MRDRIQTNGRCESANPLGDTYGPVSYIAYLPGYWFFGWSGKWDSLPSVHFTSLLFDALALLGLGLVGRRLGGPRLGATLAFAWAAWPFTQYASNSNTNDAIMPAFLIWGFFALTSPAVRGVSVALSGWTKFASLLVVPLWSGYPEARRGRTQRASSLWFAVATALVFFVLFLEPSPLHAARVFVDRTVRFQVGRDSPFSIWDWGQYHAKGIPSLKFGQYFLQALLVLGSLALGCGPAAARRCGMAAFTAVLLIGFELVLTHWSYLYLPWFFPFVAMALIAPLAGIRPPTRPEPPSRRPIDHAEDRPRVRCAGLRLTGPLATAAAVATFLIAWGLVHRWFWGHTQLIDTPTTGATATRWCTRACSRTATSTSTIRRAPCRCSRCRRSPVATPQRSPG